MKSKRREVTRRGMYGRLVERGGMEAARRAREVAHLDSEY